ncbi:MAG: PLP-dependent transferase [Candidatus Gracilibacteria bacterium]
MVALEGRDLEEFLAVDVIADFTRKLRENAVLVDILCHEGVTQDFCKAADMAAAFKGELTEMPEADVEAKVAAVKLSCASVINDNGITDEQLRSLFRRVWVYARLSHPSVQLAEEVISEMEGAEATAVFSSGLAAINAVVEHSTSPARRGEQGEYVNGGKIVVIGSVYGGTHAQLVDTAEKTGRVVEFLTLEEFEQKGLPPDTKLVFFEPCNNPTLEIMPLSAIVEAAHTIGAQVACDNTFTPLSVKPLELGVDVVLHSLTKYAGGKSEDTGGSASGHTAFISQFSDLHHGKRMVGGASMAARVAWALLQNMQDLPERLYKATQNARALKAVAEQYGLTVHFVEDDSNYASIRNPKIPNSVSNGMLAVDFETQEKARAFVDNMAAKGVGRSAVSLGSVTTLYSIPADTTHSEMLPADQLKVGITPGLVRVSCGIEENLVAKAGEVLSELFAN